MHFLYMRCYVRWYNYILIADSVHYATIASAKTDGFASRHLPCSSPFNTLGLLPLVLIPINTSPELAKPFNLALENTLVPIIVTNSR